MTLGVGALAVPPEDFESAVQICMSPLPQKWTSKGGGHQLSQLGSSTAEVNQAALEVYLFVGKLFQSSREPEPEKSAQRFNKKSSLRIFTLVCR